MSDGHPSFATLAALLSREDREALEERAAIIEFDGNEERTAAEAEAVRLYFAAVEAQP